MQKFELTVTDENGIHARPAGLLVKAAQGLSSDVTVTCREKSADAKKLFAVMSLGATHGDRLTVTVAGPNEKSDAETLRHFMEQAWI